MGILGIIEHYFTLLLFFALLFVAAIGSVRGFISYLMPFAPASPELTRVIREEKNRVWQR